MGGSSSHSEFHEKEEEDIYVLDTTNGVVTTLDAASKNQNGKKYTLPPQEQRGCLSYPVSLVRLHCVLNTTQVHCEWGREFEEKERQTRKRQHLLVHKHLEDQHVLENMRAEFHAGQATLQADIGMTRPQN